MTNWILPSLLVLSVVRKANNVAVGEEKRKIKGESLLMGLSALNEIHEHILRQAATSVHGNGRNLRCKFDIAALEILGRFLINYSLIHDKLVNSAKRQSLIRARANRHGNQSDVGKRRLFGSLRGLHERERQWPDWICQAECVRWHWWKESISIRNEMTVTILKLIERWKAGVMRKHCQWIYFVWKTSRTENISSAGKLLICEKFLVALS